MKSPLKWPGGKAPLARWIVSLMLPHTHYVEPYFGAGSVLFQKSPEGVSEVANDLNGELMNFWRVLQTPPEFSQFLREVQCIPVAEPAWDFASRTYDSHPIGRAVLFFVRVRQSLAGRGDTFTALSRTRTRRGMNEQASSWLTAVEGLPEVHARLKRVVILNRPALDVIRSEDGPNTLFYLDPPYLHKTRNTTREYGELEMSERDHQELLVEITSGRPGKVMISGYRSKLYDLYLSGWACHEKEVANHASHAKTKGREVECVWCNF